MKNPNLLLLILLLYACADSNEYFKHWPNGNIKEKRLYNPQYDRGEGNYEVWGYDESGNLSFAGHKINGKKTGGWTIYNGQ